MITNYKVNAVYRFGVKAATAGGSGAELAPRIEFYECSKYATDTLDGCQVGCTTITALGGFVCSARSPNSAHKLVA